MIAAGYDLPCVQAQVGHANPSVTLAVYAQVMRRADRDELRAGSANYSASRHTRLTESCAHPTARTKRPETAANSVWNAHDGRGARGKAASFQGVCEYPQPDSNRRSPA